MTHRRRGAAFMLVIFVIGVFAGLSWLVAEVFAGSAAHARRAELAIRARQVLASGAAWAARNRVDRLAQADPAEKSLDVGALLPGHTTGQLDITAVTGSESQRPGTMAIRARVAQGRLEEHATKTIIDTAPP